jgi:hypothetical protein
MAHNTRIDKTFARLKAADKKAASYYKKNRKRNFRWPLFAKKK